MKYCALYPHKNIILYIRVWNLKGIYYILFDFILCFIVYFESYIISKIVLSHINVEYIYVTAVWMIGNTQFS